MGWADPITRLLRVRTAATCDKAAPVPLPQPRPPGLLGSAASFWERSATNESGALKGHQRFYLLIEFEVSLGSNGRNFRRLRLARLAV